MREDHLGHHALVARVNFNLAIAVRPDEIALLDERHDGCRVILYLVDHAATPQLAVDRDLADDGVPPGRNGIVLAIDVHDGRLREHEVADNLAAIPALGGFALPLLFLRLALARPLQLLGFALLGREVSNGEIVERNLVPRPLTELQEFSNDPTASAE
jgi:hypothetical protein